MKTRIIFSITAAALALAACMQELDSPEPETVLTTIHACQEGNGDTRTMVQDGGTQVLWEPEDKVKVFFKGAESCFVTE